MNKIGIALILALVLNSCGTPAPTQEELRESAGTVENFFPGESEIQWQGCGLLEITDFENGFCVGQNFVFEHINTLGTDNKPYEFFPIGKYLSKVSKFDSRDGKTLCEAALLPKVWEYDGAEMVFEFPKVKTDFISGCQLAISRTYEFAMEDYRSRTSEPENSQTPECETESSEYSCDDQYLFTLESEGGYYTSISNESTKLNMATKFCENLDNGMLAEEWLQMGMTAKPGDEDWTQFLSAIAAASLIYYCPEYQYQALAN